MTVGTEGSELMPAMVHSDTGVMAAGDAGSSASGETIAGGDVGEEVPLSVVGLRVCAAILAQAPPTEEIKPERPDDGAGMAPAAPAPCHPCWHPGPPEMYGE